MDNLEHLEGLDRQDTHIHVGIVNGQVVLRLEQPVQYLCLSPAQAWKLGNHLQQLAQDSSEWRPSPHDASQPYVVQVRKEQSRV